MEEGEKGSSWGGWKNEKVSKQQKQVSTWADRWAEFEWQVDAVASGQALTLSDVDKQAAALSGLRSRYASSLSEST